MCISLVHVAILHHNARCKKHESQNILLIIQLTGTLCYVCKHWVAQNSQVNVVGNDPVAWNREKCIESILCSGPEGLKHADLNVTVLWAAIQILQTFIMWIKLPSQISTSHYWPFWFIEVCWACRPYGRKWK